MKERHSHQILSHAATAKHIAEWSIITAEDGIDVPEYLLISATVFLAFMLEGVVNHLGTLLVDEWEVRHDGKRGKGYLPFKARHKLVREAVGYNGWTVELGRTIKELFDFRDSFAHPKKQSYSKRERAESFTGKPLPRVGWQTLTPDGASETFGQVNDYCNALLEAGKVFFEGMSDTECYKRYGIHEPQQIAVALDLLLYSKGESISTVSHVPVKKKKSATSST